MPRKKAETVSFEEGLKRLETIVEQLESGDLPLEQTVALYKEGMELSQNCAAQLKKVCKSTPLRISGASQKGVPEALQKLFKIIDEDKKAQRAAEIEAEMTLEEKAEGWQP